MCLALGVNNLDDIGHDIEKLFHEVVSPKENFFDKLKMLPLLNNISSYMPKHIKGKGACQENIIQHPDLNVLPVLKCWPCDGGPFITLPIVHTIDPITKIPNQGMYRMQVFSKEITGMHWHLHKGSARHFDEYKKAGIQRMPVSVGLGGDPVYTYCATAPLPENVDEYILAGFIRKKKVNLVKCISNDLYVPEDCDIIIEGYVDTTEDFLFEGPFGDHTGYYSLADYYPAFHVTCITHRTHAVYPATIVGIPPQEDAWLGKATERIFVAPIRLTMLPEVVDMDMPVEGVFHNIAIVSIKKNFPGHAVKVMNALWGAGQMMFNKMMVIVDAEVDIHNYTEVMKAIYENTCIEEDVYLQKGPLDVLDHSSNQFAFGGKLGLDATRKNNLAEKNNFRFSESLKEKIKAGYPEIIKVNDALSKQNIPLLILSVKKNKPDHISILHKQLVNSGIAEGIKFIVYLDEPIDIFDLKNVVWRCSNNTDAFRDIFKVTSGSNKTILGIDGTMKNKQFDGFQRDWPNIVVSDEKTIKAIDEKWSILGLGEFIPSPSLKYQNQLYGKGAVAEE